MPFIYHLKPRNLLGDTLMPLNQLKDTFPELYEEKIVKYNGREHLLTRTIPILDCLWNDVVFFSPVPPEAIKAAFINIVGQWRETEWLCVDTDDYNITNQNAVFKYPDMTREKGDFTIREQDYAPFDPDKLTTMREIPQHTLDYYAEAHAAGERILVWHGIPQILYKESINVSNMVIAKI